MSIVAIERGAWTFEQFCDRIPEGLKADLIEGVIHVASPDNVLHFRINSWFDYVLRRFLKERKIGGELFGYRIAFRMDDENGPEPDLAFVSDDRLHLVRKTFVKGPPDWALEIVSPTSVDRDYEDKHAQYERFGVGEYWIIDPMSQSMVAYRLGKTRKYKEIRPRDGRITSHIIAGFWVKPEWFWQSPLPDEDETLREIATGSNGKR